ncbi:MAG: M42 family peptidase, partial [Firmicutes bacterium]|nr:M42 family peptidase [Bacillota bacterium]
MTEKKISLEMIRDLSIANAPSGFEDEALEVVRRYSEGLGEIEEDHIRNLYISRKENSGKPLMMLDAHADEVGFMVHSIKSNGTIRFVNIGGWNPATLPSSRVLVRNSEGKYIPGIVSNKPVHFMKQADRDRKIEISDLS